MPMFLASNPVPIHVPATPVTAKTPVAAAQKNFTDPLQVVRNVLQAALPVGEMLPTTKAFELYYVRGVCEFQLNGQSGEAVLFPPEFVYLVDVGWPRMAGVTLSYSVPVTSAGVIGYGDPRFPNFAQTTVYSIEARTPRDIIFPFAAGEILVGFRIDVAPDDAAQRLAPYLTNVQGSGRLYQGRGRILREPEVVRDIEANVADVKYAEGSRILRLVDFIPGWFVDRVM